jgi:hypothetical protein
VSGALCRAGAENVEGLAPCQDLLLRCEGLLIVALLYKEQRKSATDAFDFATSFVR